MSPDLDLQAARDPIAGSARTMSIGTIEQDFHRKVSQKIRLSGEGIDRFRVFTPFLFDDGDHLVIVLSPARHRRLRAQVADREGRPFEDLQGQLARLGPGRQIGHASRDPAEVELTDVAQHRYHEPFVHTHRHTEMDRPVPMNRTVDQRRVQRRVRLQGDGDGLEDDVVQVIITTDECAIPASPASALGSAAV